jgi:hypothetical protein
LYEKKRRLKKALEEGTAVPTELRLEEQQLEHELQMDDEMTGAGLLELDLNCSTSAHQLPTHSSKNSHGR